MSSSDRDTAVRRSALPFRLHASVTCPPPAELAASLAWELGDVDVERVERALTALTAATPADLEPDATRTSCATLGESSPPARCAPAPTASC